MEHQSNNQNPSGIWQQIWAKLFWQAIDQITFQNFIGAWETLQLLKVQIPPECEEDTIEAYKKTEAVMKKPISSYNYVATAQKKQRQIQSEAPEALRELIGAVRKSLYIKGWINKDFTIRPTHGTADIKVKL